MAWVHRISDPDDLARTATCSTCGPVSIKIRVHKDGRVQRMCRNRVNGDETRRRQGDPRYARKRRDTKLRLKFGISLDDFNQMLARQCGLCFICQKRETQKRSLAFDHNHATGSARRLLCFRCNTVLGLMDDDPDLLATAAAYLRAH